jgi:hypothetical protein
MDIDTLSKKLGWLPAPVLAWLEVRLKRIPAIRERIQRIIHLVSELESAQDYRGFLPPRLPGRG